MTVGLVGLGNMGAELARNLVENGVELVTHDIAGAARSPHGAKFAAALDDLAEACDVVVLSLPDGAVSAHVVDALTAAPQRRVRCVIDTSTVGLAAAQTNSATLTAAGVEFIDAAVSGGPAGARARTLTVMYAGSDDACRLAEPVLSALSDQTMHVGATAGLAQALKLANNFLSATALAATSEAMLFCVDAGLDLATALRVINASSGRSAASEDKFPNHVVANKYASGFANSLMAKDVALYLADAVAQHTPTTIGKVTVDVWQRFAAAEPGVDFTRIYPYVDSTRGDHQ